ncbi:MAG: sodium:proton antiporter [Candidatus Eisenbacteria bacterium]|nr:sodium:proton antiporter [Candidatus Eisenbacteria bacterium]
MTSEQLGALLPPWTGIPFVGILLSIALLPIVAPKHWEDHYPKVALFWAALFAIPFLVVFRGTAAHEILHIYLVDYVPFIILLWGLFTVSGGILLRGRLQGTPLMNTVFLAVGTALASWMGTTGAAMLMIRPLLRANAARKRKKHIFIFLIFLVANVGGALTPLGDPPLFLGFLHGVPFSWTFAILPHMLLVAACLLVLHYLIDSYHYRRETREVVSQEKEEVLRLEGGHNVLFLGGILGAVLLSGMWKAGSVSVVGIEMETVGLIRDLIIVAMGILSLRTTRKHVRRDNNFTWHPIIEVAYLFAGIFMTIVPVLAILRAGESGAMAFLMNAVTKPAHYFWAAGGLSSFLDNAPTYLTFFNLALGRLHMPEACVNDVLCAVVSDPSGGQFALYLKAISAGAVFFGANTYIGNAPNFMVKSIAESHRVKMPSFFGYMAWSGAILIPVFALVALVFFR